MRRAPLLALVFTLSACMPWREVDLGEDDTRASINSIHCTPSSIVLRVYPSRFVFRGTEHASIPNAPSINAEHAWVAPDETVFMADSENGFRFAGDTWETLPLEPAPYAIETVWGTSAEHVYMVDRGRVYVLEGDHFQGYDAGTWRHLTSVWSSGDGDLWVAGQDGVVRVHTGGRWIDRSPPTRELLRGITGSSASRVWVWSENEIWAWDGHRWVDRFGSLDRWVTTVLDGGGEDIYAGDASGIARFVNGRWERLQATGFVERWPHELCLTDDELVTHTIGVQARARRSRP